MVVDMNIEEESHMSTQRPVFLKGMGSLGDDLIPNNQSPDSMDSPKHVVVVMDGLKEFTLEPLEWVFKNIALQACCHVTLLGVMPWLNIPLSSKTWSDVWTKDLEELLAMREKSELKNDAKYQRFQELIDLCQKYAVVPQIRAEMGYPLQLVAVEQVTGLHATLVVFDRHHKKFRDFYAEKIPCNMVMMNDDGEVDMIKSKSGLIDNVSTPGESPASMVSSPLVVLSDQLKRFLKH